VTSSPVDREVYNEHQTVIKALVGCRDVLVSADKSQAPQNSPVAEAVGPSGCVYLITKVLCLASDHHAHLSAHSHFTCVRVATHF
jgi:hypothetical protein